MRRPVLVVAIVIAAVALAVGPGATRAAASGVARPPVADVDLPDPALVTDGAHWYAFGTNTTFGGHLFNVPVLWGASPTQLSSVNDALPTLGSWATPGFTWAPGVAHVGSTWVLWYTAAQASSGRQCIGRATATSALGPYKDLLTKPVVCQLDHGGSIDPSPFQAADGSRWLQWKSDDNAIGALPAIWSARLTADGLSLAGLPVALLSTDAPWESGIIEGPSMITAGGRTWLFYAAGYFESAGYAEGYATCSGPGGPCQKVTTTAPWMDGPSTGLVGPGGASFISFGSYAVMAFHSWRNAIGPGGWRAPSVEPVSFAPSPDWQPSWYQGVPGWRGAAPGAGAVTMDRYGEIHPPDGTTASDQASWPGWPIARALAMSTSGGGGGGVTLDGWGGIHPFRLGASAKPTVGSTPWWQGWDIARDLVVAAWSPTVTGYELDGWGGVHPVGGAPPVAADNYWPGWDIARRVALLSSGTAGYMLDGWGGVHPFAADGTAMPPPASGTAYWVGWDIATALAVNPDGSGGYTLDGWGGLHPFAAGGAAPAAVTSSYYAPAGPAAVDLVVTDWSSPSGYIVDAAGDVHPFG